MKIYVSVKRKENCQYCLSFASDPSLLAKSNAKFVLSYPNVELFRYNSISTNHWFKNAWYILTEVTQLLCKFGFSSVKYLAWPIKLHNIEMTKLACIAFECLWQTIFNTKINYLASIKVHWIKTRECVLHLSIYCGSPLNFLLVWLVQIHHVMWLCSAAERLPGDGVTRLRKRFPSAVVQFP